MGGHVVVAPDKFKGSLSAAGVARAVAEGLRAAVPGVQVREHPVADGGDGTVEAALSAGYTRREVRCTGPTGTPVDAAVAVRDPVAVVELAEASGLRRLPGTWNLRYRVTFTDGPTLTWPNVGGADTIRVLPAVG